MIGMAVTVLLLAWCLQSLVLRVKRKNLTVFVTAEPTDTVLEVKHKLHDMLGQVGLHAQARSGSPDPSRRNCWVVLEV